MYRLAHMYQNGLGVTQSHEKAAYWYQKAAATYQYTLIQPTKEEEEDKGFIERMSDQIDPSTNVAGAAYALQKLDTNTPETKSMMEYLFDDANFFGLKPHRENFMLPVSYASKKYRRITSGKLHQDMSNKYKSYDENTEVHFQVSLKKPLTYDLFGWNEYITAAYTQKVWWQLYSDSGPFRETNYLPELFMTIPTSDSIDDSIGLTAVKGGFIHESNGQEGYRSRSWNRLFLTGLWQWDNLFLESRIWYRLSEDNKYDGYYDGLPDDDGVIDPNDDGDDNLHIQNYLGYGDLRFNYLFGKHEVGTKLRYNFGMGGQNRGAIESHWSYPFLGSKNTFWFVQFFTGYGESLIDFDRSVTKTSFGFSFNRGLF